MLTSTHIGNFISKIMIIFSEKYKMRFIIFCICFMLSFGLTVGSHFFLQENEVSELDKKYFIYLNLISRFIYGFSCGRLITRKYIMLYLPESEIKYYSSIYLITNYIGILLGIIINVLTTLRGPFNIKYISFNIDNHIFLFAIGFLIAFISLID